MAAGTSAKPGGGGDNGTAGGPRAAGLTKNISEIQLAYVLANHPDAVAYPPRRDGDSNPPPAEFVYQQGALLTRERDLPEVLVLLSAAGTGKERGRGRGRSADGAAIQPTVPAPGLALVQLLHPDLPADPVAADELLTEVITAADRRIGFHTVARNTLLSVSQTHPPATWCAATEPEPEPVNVKVPLPRVSESRCDGHGTLVVVADTGLDHAAAAAHSWMKGVAGDPDTDVAGGVIDGYGGHGTFCASTVRTMAPHADVWVSRVFAGAGAAYETDVVAGLLPLLAQNPAVISLSAGTHTWDDRTLLGFDFFVSGPLSQHPDTVLVAAAGNDGYDWKFAPAEMGQVIGVGALGAPGDTRAWFSDFGDWVKVFAPGQNLVQAFPRGTYNYRETPGHPPAKFSGMARWSGTSFSAPIVAGLIAARMSGTGETASGATASLLQLARAQALPGVGPVLHPGQACLCVHEDPCRPRPGYDS
jgi:subtilisin family serine protease